MKKFGIIAFLCFFSLLAAAQESHPYIKHFSAQSQDGKLFLSWTTHAGFSCQDIEIELSTDTVNFVKKGTYFGVCGDFDEKDYTYVVEDPYPNTLNYIRLNLGTYGWSYVISQRVVKLERAVLIIPNPVTTESVFYFDNNGVDEVTVEFYSRNGQLLSQILTDENHIEMANVPFAQGLIVYRILYPKEAIRGKFFFEQY